MEKKRVMELKKIGIDELIKELDRYKYKEFHIHHTWKPSHKDFTGSNHIRLQEGMKNYHMVTNGWSDIAQHISIFPDGQIVTGRDFGRDPASMTGYNTGAFMVENIGNFDIGHDSLYGKQKETLLKLTKYFIDRLGENKIIFHRERSGKTCPGTGINKNLLIEEAKGVKNLTIRHNSRGNHVKELQSNLKAFGFDVGAIDGIAGNKTIGAIKSFQNAHGLVDDGIFGTKSYEALERALKAQEKHFAEDAFNNLNNNGVKIHEKRFDDEITRGEVFVLLDQMNKKKDDLEPVQVFKHDNQTTVVKIRRDAIEEVDVITANTKSNRELLSSMRIRTGVDYIISGGLWWTDKEEVSHSLNLLLDEYKQIRAGIYSRFGLMIYKDKSYKFGEYSWTPELRDMLGGSPSLVVDGKVKIDGEAITGRHPRAGIGMNDTHFFLVTIDGRQEGMRGATNLEFANVMLSLGCEFAMAGDGGGTVRMEDRNGPINKPTENRASNNAIGIKIKEEYR